MKKLLIILLFLGLAGCATTQRMVLKYTPVIQKQQAKNITICIKPFQDKRAVTDVGRSYGMIGNVSSKAVAENSVVDWAADALKSELQNAGYNIACDETVKNIIEGDVIEVLCETVFIYHGKITLQIFLKQNNKEIFKEIYSLKKKGGANLGTTTKGYNDTLNITLQEIIKLMIDDINKKLLN